VKISEDQWLLKTVRVLYAFAVNILKIQFILELKSRPFEDLGEVNSEIRKKERSKVFVKDPGSFEVICF
jgi:hypothetical protein